MRDKNTIFTRIFKMSQLFIPSGELFPFTQELLTFLMKWGCGDKQV